MAVQMPAPPHLVVAVSKERNLNEQWVIVLLKINHLPDSILKYGDEGIHDAIWECFPRFWTGSIDVGIHGVNILNPRFTPIEDYHWTLEVLGGELEDFEIRFTNYYKLYD